MSRRGSLSGASKASAGLAAVRRSGRNLAPDVTDAKKKADKKDAI